MPVRDSGSVHRMRHRSCIGAIECPYMADVLELECTSRSRKVTSYLTSYGVVQAGAYRRTCTLPPVAASVGMMVQYLSCLYSVGVRRPAYL